MSKKEPSERKGKEVCPVQWELCMKRPRGRGTWQVQGRDSHCSKEQRLRWTPNTQNDDAGDGLGQDWNLRLQYNSTLYYTFSHQHHRIQVNRTSHSPAHCFDLWIQWEGKKHPVRIADVFHSMCLWSLGSCQYLRRELQKYCQGLSLVSVKTAFF